MRITQEPLKVSKSKLLGHHDLRSLGTLGFRIGKIFVTKILPPKSLTFVVIKNFTFLHYISDHRSLLNFVIVNIRKRPTCIFSGN